MPRINYDPAGAIRTVEELQALIAAANAGEAVKLYEVNGVYPSVRPICLLKTAEIVEHKFDSGRASLMCRPNGGATTYDEFFLSDSNIGESYNNNYMFANLACAEACRDFMLSDPYHIAARKAWLAECRELDDFLDDNYDGGYYDD